MGHHINHRVQVRRSVTEAGSREKGDLADDSDQWARMHPRAEPWGHLIRASLLSYHPKV